MSVKDGAGPFSCALLSCFLSKRQSAAPYSLAAKGNVHELLFQGGGRILLAWRDRRAGRGAGSGGRLSSAGRSQPHVQLRPRC